MERGTIRLNKHIIYINKLKKPGTWTGKCPGIYSPECKESKYLIPREIR